MQSTQMMESIKSLQKQVKRVNKQVNKQIRRQVKGLNQAFGQRQQSSGFLGSFLLLSLPVMAIALLLGQKPVRARLQKFARQAQDLQQETLKKQQAKTKAQAAPKEHKPSLQAQFKAWVDHLNLAKALHLQAEADDQGHQVVQSKNNHKQDVSAGHAIKEMGEV